MPFLTELTEGRCDGCGSCASPAVVHVRQHPQNGSMIPHTLFPVTSNGITYSIVRWLLLMRPKECFIVHLCDMDVVCGKLYVADSAKQNVICATCADINAEVEHARKAYD